MNDFKSLSPIFKQTYAKKKKGDNRTKLKRRKEQLLKEWEQAKKMFRTK